MDVVHAIENAETGDGDRPKKEIKIVKSGELKEEEEKADEPTEVKAETDDGKETAKEEL